jgi:hypothetical protein
VKEFQVVVEGLYLTVIPAVSSSLDDPSYRSNDTEDSCDPMTAVEDSDCLNDTRGSSTKGVSLATRILRITANLPWDTEDPKNRSGSG